METLTLATKCYGYMVRTNIEGAKTGAQVYQVRFDTVAPLDLDVARDQIARLPLLPGHKIMECKIYTNWQLTKHVGL